MLTTLLSALVEPSPRTRNAVGEDVLQAFLAQSPTEQLKAIEADLRRLPDEQLQGVVKALAPMLRQPFIPLPGPQTAAYNSLADELLFGGQAGGSKSYLLLGCAATRHHRSLILRRQSTELDGLVADLHTMIGRDGWRYEGTNGGTHTLKGRVIRLGGCREPDDWNDYAGRARDFLGLDEAGEFLEQQVSALIAWVRSTDPNQRCRVIMASNPPRGAEGFWLVEWFSPWLDPSFPNPASYGELRWYIRVKDKTRWVEGPGEYEVEGETYTSRSRTFIPATLDDNPFLARTDYRARLQNLPEPLRSQLLKGDFFAGREDDAWQVIPSDWIQRARLRWTPDRPNRPMTSLGIDVAQGGADRTTLAPRYGKWFAPIKVADGVETPDGLSVASLAFREMRDGCTVVVDVGGGWGADAYGHLSRHLPDDVLVGFMGVTESLATSANGIERFANKRAEAWWRFREALDPDMGAEIALPPDPELAAELAMPRRVPEKKLIQIESKEQIRKRLGRSPDKADAVVMAWLYGSERAEQRLRQEDMQARANVGYERAKGLRSRVSDIVYRDDPQQVSYARRR